MTKNLHQRGGGMLVWLVGASIVPLLPFSPSPLLPFSPSTKAAERSPEQLLPPTTQIYARWDGVTAHRDAYRNSARGQMFNGEAGKALDAMWEQIERTLKRTLAGEPLLQGMPPDELARIHADVKALLRIPNLLMDTGLVAGFELRPPSYDFGKLLKFIRGDAVQRERMKDPSYLLTIVVPGAAEKAELAAAIRLVKTKSNTPVKEQVVAGRKVVFIEDPDDPIVIAAWAEDKHFVFALGNLPVERIVRKIKEAGAGITENPLYTKLGTFKEFEVVTRGYIDVAGIVSTWDTILKVFEPDFWAVAQATGLTGIKSFCFWDGFEKEESRGVIEIEFAGKRKGLTRMFQPQPSKDGVDKPFPLKMEDLPPLPADLTRFAAARLDPGAVYELIVPLTVYVFNLGDGDDADKALSAEERLKNYREKILQEFDNAVGFKAADLFGALGDTCVTYHAPSDGLPLSGQVLAISVKDAKTLKRCLDMLSKKIEGFGRNEVKIQKRDCLGIEVREFVVREKSPVTVSYAICDGWLVIGLQPQPVRGFIHRAKGNLPRWKPDERTARTLAKVPADRCVLQVADPRATLQWFLGAGPILAGSLGNEFAAILEASLIPHAGEASKHLFPNVMWCRDDGRIMRYESRDSLWLPFEFVGLESVVAFFVLDGAPKRFRAVTSN